MANCRVDSSVFVAGWDRRKREAVCEFVWFEAFVDPSTTTLVVWLAVHSALMYHHLLARPHLYVPYTSGDRFAAKNVIHICTQCRGASNIFLFVWTFFVEFFSSPRRCRVTQAKSDRLGGRTSTHCQVCGSSSLRTLHDHPAPPQCASTGCTSPGAPIGRAHPVLI